ncbi:MAG: hypothetical protein ACJ75J_11480 [Cytophagaceae bacterium]
MKKFILTPICALIAWAAFSQDVPETLDSKWDTMLNKSENYADYKVISKNMLNDMHKSVQDSVSKLKSDLQNERSKVKAQSDKIFSLNQQIKEGKQQFDQVSDEKNSMNFLGMQLNKYAYTVTLWFLLIGVSVGAVLLFFLYKNSKKITDVKGREYHEIAKQLDEAKAAKVETERKLKRELQTLMNKLEELKRKN